MAVEDHATDMSKRGLTGSDLKWIAILTMAVDHIGAVLYPEMLWMRYIGRIAFPVFCFLLVEGFHHTRNLRKYMIRLLLFALISEIPYDLAFYHTVWYPAKQNVFFTLAIGLGMLWFWNHEKEPVMKAGLLIVAMWFAEMLHTDYHGYGVLLIAMFQIVREKKKIWLVLCGLWNFLWKSMIQYAGILAIPLIALYNGEKGNGLKYFFYVFYPLHLIILYLIKCFV